MSLPLLVRPNSIIAVGHRDNQPDYDFADGVTLQVYQLADGAQITTNIPALNGDIATVFVVQRKRPAFFTIWPFPVFVLE